MIKLRISHDLLVPNLAHAKGLLCVHQNVTVNITFYVGQEFYILWYISLSATFDILENF